MTLKLNLKNDHILRTIVVPVYNEAASAQKIIDSIMQHIDAETRLILVQDGSDDGTAEILQDLENSGFMQKNGIDLVNHLQNQGYGKALVSGFKKSLEYKNAEYILTMDCDEQHQPEDLHKFISFANTDILSGSRYLMDIEKGITAPADRVKINSRLTEKYKKKAANMLDQTWRLTDSFCGMKRYRSDFIRDFLSRLPGAHGHESCMGYGFPLLVWNFYLQWLKNQNKSLASSFAEIAIPKIYISNDRTFGQLLDFPRKRYRYYLNCMKITFY